MPDAIFTQLFTHTSTGPTAVDIIAPVGVVVRVLPLQVVSTDLLVIVGQGQTVRVNGQAVA